MSYKGWCILSSLREKDRYSLETHLNLQTWHAILGEIIEIPFNLTSISHLKEIFPEAVGIIKVGKDEIRVVIIK